jgi:hypothetical protein
MALDVPGSVDRENFQFEDIKKRSRPKADSDIVFSRKTGYSGHSGMRCLIKKYGTANKEV